MQRIRSLGEQLDGHRKRQQALHPDLTMTGMYNVLEKLRAADHLGREGTPEVREGTREVREGTPEVREGTPEVREATPEIREATPEVREATLEVREGTSEVANLQEKPSSGTSRPRSVVALTAKERLIHEQGLVSVLKQIHDDLDAAVFEAYGWPHGLDDEEILQRLVDLNHERAAEETRGKIRWRRPDFQNPAGKQATQQELIEGATKKGKPKSGTAGPASSGTPKKQPWPGSLPERITAVRSVLTQHAAPADVTDINARFSGGRNRAASIAELLDTLVTVGQARQLDDGRYVA